jgi:hypothetical protein
VRRAAALAVAALFATVLGAAGAVVPPQPPGGTAGAVPAAAQPRPAVAGLQQSWTDAAGSWAVVAMGHLDQRQNTFWQVFFRPAGAARWTLVTPPGVASNGGFSAEGAAGSVGATGTVTAGFQPSRKLRYSPIARTSDNGKSWSAGTLAAGLLPVADAVAAVPGGAVIALVRPEGGSLVRSQGSLTAWKTVADRRALDRTAGRSCGLDALTAVVYPVGTGAAIELGGACTSPDVVGLFHRLPSGQWASTGVRIGGAGHSTFTVLRLVSGPAGTSALLEARQGARASLVALWRNGPAAKWVPSRPVRLKGSVLSTTATGGSLLVVTGAGARGRDVLWAAGPGSGWRPLGAPPGGTQVVTLAPGAAPSSTGPGALSALSVAGSEVTVWERTGAGRWRRTAQRFHVPIQYGSST